MKKFFLILTISLLFFIITEAKATTIFSPLLEMEIDPGQSQSGVVKVYNETDQDIFLTSSVESFSAGDETGQPIFIPLEERNSYLSWFKVADEEIILRPSQVGIIPFIVTVPAEAVPGGYYAVIFWKNAPGPLAPGSEVSVSSKVGTLIFLKVKGEVFENGEILEFKTQPPQNYFFSLPISFSVRFKNSGNVHLRPVGPIELTNLFGQTEVLAVNELQRNILPNSVRRFEIIWGQTLSGNWLEQFWPGLRQELSQLAFGPYKATLTLSYGVENIQTVSKELKFWLIPYRSLVVFILIIIILAVFIKINKKVKRIKQGEFKKG
ncbi:MAG: hypothetical protein A3J62_00405 [Candidatus Buchananbacteria bacterium RIFCSPHIGHO2_02_FULL_38_8]|uniref:Uncharacterized protein n=1 Tax=Candidatus Buchananbacteria bacterium RIFCSPHIGHO2_02_FULL_38_8 TaxID=1797538 RepID=A0A1G1Y426_9BACT|nr:MAG: hypothetical protein A3J62_00405 [Candidatus Buchananbacteria bacterium RIFCSPHIGHO2_02_FULL_38_8]